MNPIVVFNKNHADAEQIKKLYSVLPMLHEFGDKRSVLDDGTEVLGPQKHLELLDLKTRFDTRKRCTLYPLHSTHYLLQKIRMPQSLHVLVSFCSVVDWQGPEAEKYFLTLSDQPDPECIRIGHYNFHCGQYVASILEDLTMCIDSIRSILMSQKDKFKKAHLKIIPLGVGPTIRTRLGDALGPYIIPAYALALQYACIGMVNSQWVHTLEIVESSGSIVIPGVPGVTVVHTSRDVFDFNHLEATPVVLAPSDSFCKIGSKKHLNERTLAYSIQNNSNIHDFYDKEPMLVSWPFSNAKNTS